MKKNLILLLIFAFFILILVLGGCAPKPKLSDPRVRFEEAECQFEVPFNPKIECGTLFVPEDRSQPDSPMILLYVAIVRSSGEKPAPDPIVILQGGPGVSALGILNIWFYLFEIAMKERDLIIFDQRGVGYSQPELNCPEMEAQYYEYLVKDITLEEKIELEAQAAKACSDRLVSEGRNLSAYTSAENAADVSDLRLAMGYSEWNLYGSSYGTRLALTVIRDHPEGIRSVILDSVYPPQVDIYAELAANGERAFNLLFERCAAYPRCSKAFPNLEGMLYEVIKRVDANPLVLTVKRHPSGEEFEFVVDGYRMVQILFNIFYDTDEIQNLPKRIHQMYQEDWAEPTLMIKSHLYTPEGISKGMGNSVECVEEAPFSSQQLIDFANESVHPALREALVWGPTLATCSVWNVEPADANENAPVESDIPTLILSGGYDPVTPPAWGKLAAETLSQAQFFEFPQVSHGVLGAGRDGGRCSQKIVDAFLLDPIGELDGSCVEDQSIFFLTR